MTRVRRWILAGSTLGVLVAALAVWWAFGALDRPARTAARHDVAASASASDESAQAEAVDALIRRLPEAFASGDATLLSSAAREHGADLRQALPVGAQLAMDRTAPPGAGQASSARPR
jgi:hypothetical protein